MSIYSFDFAEERKEERADKAKAVAQPGKPDKP
jgi:hypothetical protein